LVAVDDNIPIFAVFMALPLGNSRLFFSAKYIISYPEKDEYISIMSS
jgi:hypothetical protein